MNFSIAVTNDLSIIGLGLTYVISLSGLFQYVVRQSAEIEDLVSYQILNKTYTITN